MQWGPDTEHLAAVMTELSVSTIRKQCISDVSGAPTHSGTAATIAAGSWPGPAWFGFGGNRGGGGEGGGSGLWGSKQSIGWLHTSISNNFSF